MEKIALTACNGMSAFGLIARATVADLNEENDNIISICITATSADSESFNNLIKKYPIIAINGCSNNCVDTILKKRGVNVEKNIDVLDYANENSLKPGTVARLGEDGEEFVEHLKKDLKKII